MKSIKPIEKYFADATARGRLRLTLADTWLTVEVKTPTSATPSEYGYKYTLVCAQDIRDYKRPLELCNRITNMLTEQLLSSRQDVAIMYQEWTPKERKI